MSFIPARDAQLLPWSANFSAKITAKPTAYGLTPAQASAYATLNTAFANLARNTGPGAWTTPNVIARTIARRRLADNARFLARIVQSAAGVTDTQRAELGIMGHDAKVTKIRKPLAA